MLDDTELDSIDQWRYGTGSREPMNPPALTQRPRVQFGVAGYLGVMCASGARYLAPAWHYDTSEHLTVAELFGQPRVELPTW
jgi:hypothetical protein